MGDLNGKNFGPYLIQEQLGSGGMSVVYRALDRRSQRTVALKLLRISFGDEATVLERFKAEAEIVKKLHHPAIVAVHDYGIARSHPYLVMEYMARGSLAQRFKRPAVIGSQEVVRLLRRVAAALDHAHRQGVIHRDIKLENILLDSQGEASLSDFGIARVVDGKRVTQTGTIVGTPMYMASEQARGKRNVDHRADLYSLAVVAYLLTVGRFPYGGDNVLAVLNQHVSAPLPVPSQVAPDLPSALDAVMARALAKKPDERYISADAFIEACARAMMDSAPRQTTVSLKGDPGWSFDSTGEDLERLWQDGDETTSETPDDLVNHARSAQDEDKAIAFLKRALELDPWHNEANRLLHRLENTRAAREPRSAPALPTVKPLPDFKRNTRSNQRDEKRRHRQRMWTRIGCLGSLIMSLAASWFVLNALGSGLAADILCSIAGNCPVNEVNGIPVEQLPDAVYVVEPDQVKDMAASDTTGDSLLPGYAHEYTFYAAAGEELAVAIQFFSPTAQGVSRNVAIFDPNDRPADANCERFQIFDGDTGVVFDCRITLTGTWKVRVFGREGESTGAYFVSVERFDF